MALVPLQIKISTTSTVFLLYGLVRTVIIAVVVRTAVLRIRTCAQRPPQNDNKPQPSSSGKQGRKSHSFIVTYSVHLAPFPETWRWTILVSGTDRVHFTGQCLNCQPLPNSCLYHPGFFTMSHNKLAIKSGYPLTDLVWNWTSGGRSFFAYSLLMISRLWDKQAKDPSTFPQ